MGNNLLLFRGRPGSFISLYVCFWNNTAGELKLVSKLVLELWNALNMLTMMIALWPVWVHSRINMLLRCLFDSEPTPLQFPQAGNKISQGHPVHCIPVPLQLKRACFISFPFHYRVPKKVEWFLSHFNSRVATVILPQTDTCSSLRVSPNEVVDILLHEYTGFLQHGISQWQPVSQYCILNHERSSRLLQS